MSTPELLLACLAQRADSAGLSEAVQTLTARPAKAVRGRTSAMRTAAEREAYVIARMPATSAAISDALHAAPADVLNNVTSALDIGSGPGSALWALADHCPNLNAITACERDAELIHLGQELARNDELLQQVVWQPTDITQISTFPTHDLTCASYLLHELSIDVQTRIIAALWAATTSVMVIIGPGTQADAAVIRRARHQLLVAGAHILAPCPHDGACPLSESHAAWCHFRVRFPRTRLHRRSKHGGLGYEDERYSFLIVSRQASPDRAQARILGPAKVRKLDVVLPVCHHGDYHELTVPRADPHFRQARHANWGDRWPPQLHVSSEATND